MPDPIWFKALFKALVLPPTGPLLLCLGGLVLQRKFPRGGRALAVAGPLLLLVLSMPAVAAVLLRWVNASPPLDIERARSAQAIVILGGGIRHDAAEYDGDTLGRLTLERVRYGARVARLTGLPVLVSGGAPHGGETEAKLMRNALESEFGVPVRWAEDRSRNTHENAVRSAEILRADGIVRVVLVGHGFDIPRAKSQFSDQGIETIDAPTGIPSANFSEPLMLVPSVAGLEGSYYALYEIVANVARRLRVVP
ncbi:MAG TPA: YdcF family protein [Casimicrobiaceae bacterium]|nr:YdcF family protein [Casimicrobiaceae bacterium]